VRVPSIGKWLFDERFLGWSHAWWRGDGQQPVRRLERDRHRTDTALVAVIDNTTGATLLSCTLTSGSPKGCSNTGGTGAAAAGDNIEVKITASGVSGSSKMWRVRFRY
jgi:hypothetical protein